MTSRTTATAAETPAANGHGEAHSTASFTGLLLGSIGVVYGDIGTSPLYALREAVVAATEGIKLVTEAFEHYVVPLTLIILMALFAVQSRGTARVASLFGPIMCLWFAVIAVAAIPQIMRHPEVLQALNPLYAVSFMLH